MSDTAEHGTRWWQRASQTPLRDIVRGRLSCRLDINAPLVRAELPAAIEQLIRRVVRSTRLWRIEKADVARELIAHFKDGLAGGSDADELVSSFGDPTSAARLIRRAKKRGRPLPWRMAKRGAQGLGALLACMIVLYVVLVVRYYMGEPKITRDYVAEYNAAVDAIPEEQRAWPVYLEAIKAWQPPAASLYDLGQDMLAVMPGDEHWPDVQRYATGNTKTLALIREAAALPSLGRPLAHTIDPALKARQQRFRKALGLDDALDADARDQTQQDQKKPSEHSMLVYIMLPELSEFRQMARLLVMDAHHAAATGDAETVVADLAAMMGVAEHAGEDPWLISDLVKLAIFAFTTKEIERILIDQPDLLSDAQWRDLAHRVAAFDGGGRLTITLSGERDMFLDIVQRFYTDDGHGNGHMTSKGWEMLRTINMVSGNGAGAPPPNPIAAPLGSAIVADRKTMVRKYKHLMDAQQATASMNLWERQRSMAQEELDEIRSAGFMHKIRYPLLDLLASPFERVSTTGDFATQERDATLVAIALELYHRREGSYPAMLDALTPDLLPAVPADQFDGTPIKYELREGLPLLYSVGADLTDNGGIPPADGNKHARQWIGPAQLARDATGPKPNYRGDWILYPTPVEGE